jgi:CDP-glucose 4,6-dehydratase
MVNPTRSFWKGKRVLVTGHSGFKGSWMTLWLHQMEADVLGLSLDRRSDGELFVSADINMNCSSVFSNLNAPETWRDAVVAFNPEIVFHLAAQSLVHEGYESPVETFLSNVMGTVHLLEVLRDVKSLKSVVVATTDKVYRDVHLRTPFREDDHLGGNDPYSASKAACELAVASYRKSFFASKGVAISTARAGNVIGGGDWATNRLIPDAIRAWSKNQTLEIRNPHSVRPWQHVLEPLCGYLVLAEFSFTNNSISTAVNFGPKKLEDFSVQSLIEQASQFFGGASYTTTSERSEIHESEWLNLDSQYALELLNYEPRLSITKSIEWTVTWYKKVLEGHYPRELMLDQVDTFTRLR